MKPILLLSALVLAALAGATGGVLATRCAAPPSSPPPVGPGPEPDAASRADDGAIDARFAELTDEVDALRDELARLREAPPRTPASETAPAKVAGAEDLSSAAFAAIHGDAIKQVIEQDRAEQARKREEERAQRELAQLVARAERTGRDLGLTPEQQKSLADVYALEARRLEELRASFREDGGARANPELARQTFEEMRTWREAELSTRFGSDLAAKIAEHDQGRGARGQRRRAGSNGGNGGNDANGNGAGAPGSNGAGAPGSNGGG